MVQTILMQAQTVQYFGMDQFRQWQTCLPKPLQFHRGGTRLVSNARFSPALLRERMQKIWKDRGGFTSWLHPLL